MSDSSASPPDDPSEATRVMSQLGARGGRARAKALTPERRSEIARMGGQAKLGWRKPKPPSPPRTPAGEPCKVCGQLTTSKYGICDRTRACRTATQALRRGTEPSPPTQYSPCEVCGTPTRSKYGVCQKPGPCKREFNRRQYVANAEADNARRRRNAAANPERERARRRRHYLANKEAVVAQNERWRKANPERSREITRRANQKFRQRPDRPCIYAKVGCTEFALPGAPVCGEHARSENNLRKSRKRRRLQERLAKKQNGLCGWCYKPLPEDLAGAEVDHIIPKASGIVIEEEWNLALLHKACNGGRKRDKITKLAIKLAEAHGIVLLPGMGRPYRLGESRPVEDRRYRPA